MDDIKNPPAGHFFDIPMENGRILHLVIASPVPDGMLKRLSELQVVEARISNKRPAHV